MSRRVVLPHLFEFEFTEIQVQGTKKEFHAVSPFCRVVVTIRVILQVKTMTMRKEVTNFAKSERNRDIRKMDNNDSIDIDNARRHEQRYLLLSTTYGLNSSHTKKIHVGLQSKNDGSFVPAVKLSGNYAEGICFDVNTWRQFQANMEHMNLYLNENLKIKPDPIIIENISINFTTAYGARAVLVAYKENKDHVVADKVEEKEEESHPPLKKRKTYAVAIVMQKTTFLGLEHIRKCVDAHLTQLVSIVDTVDVTARYLINEIELKLPSSYIDREIIKLTIKGNYQEIERNVQTQISNLTFLDVYFNIVFVELLTLRFNEILRIILLKRES